LGYKIIQMKAIVLKEGNLVFDELPVPQLNNDEVLVKVKAISINPVDVKTSKGGGVYGWVKENDPLIIGWDISGVVTETTSAQFKAGDEVFGMVNFPGHGKGYAEYVAVPATQLALKPANISHQEAAAATLAPLTALQIFRDAKVVAGQRMLIQAGAGGVGHYAIQLAKLLGVQVIATSSAANKEFVLGLGADEHIDYHAVKFEDVVKDIDIVFDAVGGDITGRSLDVVKKGGTLVSIPGGLSEATTEKAKQLGVNAYFQLVKSSGEDMQELAELLKSGQLISHVSQVFGFEEMLKAHEQIETGRTKGKIVVQL